MIDTVIFDLDGVIVDTMALHYRSWKEIAKKIGVAFTMEDNERLRGIPRRDGLKIISKGIFLTEQHFNALCLDKARLYQQYLSEEKESIVIDGVHELLSFLAGKKYRLALASASLNAGLILRNYNLEKYFDIVSDGRFDGKGKPAPDQLLYICGALNRSPDACALVEDSINGLQAGKLAGMTCIGIGKHAFSSSDYDLYYESLSVVSPQRFISSLDVLNINQ
jgi:beta-phosphoglucomutase